VWLPAWYGGVGAMRSLEKTSTEREPAGAGLAAGGDEGVEDGGDGAVEAHRGDRAAEMRLWRPSEQYAGTGASERRSQARA